MGVPNTAVVQLLVDFQFESVHLRINALSNGQRYRNSSINTRRLQEMNSRTTDLNDRRRRITSLNDGRFDDSEDLTEAPGHAPQ